MLWCTLLPREGPENDARMGWEVRGAAYPATHWTEQTKKSVVSVFVEGGGRAWEVRWPDERGQAAALRQRCPRA